MNHKLQRENATSIIILPEIVSDEICLFYTDFHYKKGCKLKN